MNETIHQQRVSDLQELLKENKIDLAAIVPGPNLYFLSGVQSHPSERPMLLLVPAEGEPAAITPDLEASKFIEAGLPPANIFTWRDDESYGKAFEAASRMFKDPITLAAESLHMRLLELNALRTVFANIKLRELDPLLSAMRIRKSREEVRAVERAVSVAESAIAALIPRIQVGQSEKMIAAMLVEELTRAGSQAIPFGPIVSAGPNAASPHAYPSDRPIETGDLMVIDWGAVVDNYPSDITRTFAVGEVSGLSRQVYDVVRQANRAGRSAARPGATGRDIDRAARSVISGAGYGEYFIHRTGHGLGLEVHEPPYISETDRLQLAPGMLFTVEPGIYLRSDSGQAQLGVRIEDDILITEGSSRSLTTFSRELIQVGL